MKKNIYLILAAIALVIIMWFAINSLVHRGGFAQGRSLSAMYKNAQDLESKDAYLNAQALYKDILDKAQDEILIQKVQKNLMGLNMKMLFSPLATVARLASTRRSTPSAGCGRPARLQALGLT